VFVVVRHFVFLTRLKFAVLAGNFGKSLQQVKLNGNLQR
jgi:hypothetical protein